MLEEPDEDETMPEAEAEDAEGSEAAEQELEQAPGSYVASLLQQTSLEDHPGRPWTHTCLIMPHQCRNDTTTASFIVCYFQGKLCEWAFLQHQRTQAGVGCM